MSSDCGNGVNDNAIVIKNIPLWYPEDYFRAKLFPQLGLNPPWAFNYHRRKTDGLFVGIAFANFTSSCDAQAAIDSLNNYELETRKLQVEKKFFLPKEEEERKRFERLSRRQNTTESPAQAPELATGGHGGRTQQFDYSTVASDILPVRLRPRLIPEEHPLPSFSKSITYQLYINKGLDMNDLETLGFYIILQIFRHNPQSTRTALQFPAVLTGAQRNLVRALADNLGLEHAAHGEHPDRYITVRLPEIVPEQQPEDSESDNLMARGSSPYSQHSSSSEHLTDGDFDLSKHLSSSLSRIRHLRRVVSVGDIPNHIFRSLDP